MRIVAENSEERLAICKECPFFNAEKSKCKKCGCYMKVKTLLPRAKCPMRKWGCPDCEVK